MSVIFSRKSTDDIEKKIGYVFKDKSLLLQAFTRTSYCNEHREGGKTLYQSNEVLEFFGDSVLSAAIVTLLMKDFATRYEHGISTKLNEGDFSNIKSKLSDKKHLSDRTRELSLQSYLLMGEGDAKLGIGEEPSVMEDLFESIIGAVYIDSGNSMSAVISVVAKMLDVNNYLEAKNPPIQSHKNALQEFCADKKRRLAPPVYKTVSESGPEHKKIYERACYIGDRLYATGKGKNQKLADSAAAEAALKILMAEDEEKKKPQEDPGALLKLRDVAKARKVAMPHFKDLGEASDSTALCPKFRIACLFDGKECVGEARDKSSARIVAADRMLKEVNPPRVKKTPPKFDKKVEKNKIANHARLQNNTKKRIKSNG